MYLTTTKKSSLKLKSISQTWPVKQSEKVHTEEKQRRSADAYRSSRRLAVRAE